ncbi:MAG: plastocyanin/azurin family copper-binding protein [Rudaea sp.]
MKRLLVRTAVLLLFGILVIGSIAFPSIANGQTGTTPTPAQAPIASRTVTDLVGAGQDTEQVMRFFPQNLTVRAGDTVDWKMNGDEIHTVSFMGQDAFKGTPANWLTQDTGDVPGRMVPGLVVPLANAQSPTDVQFDPLMFFPTRQQGAPVEHFSGSGFISSGVMAKTAPPFVPPGTPANDTFSVVFDKPGTYTFVCLVHLGAMRGTVTVLPQDATAVPSQAEIDSEAQKEIAPMIGLVKAAEGQGQALARKEPGTNGTTTYYVRAGNVDFTTGDITAQSFAFYPQTATIQAGDTVVWSSTYIHTITFKPSPPPPAFAVLKPQTSGPPLLLPAPEVFTEARPSATYDPTQYYNSGDLGIFGSNGWSWALTFDKPGTYEYYCALHQELGMKGTIIVQPK